MQKTARNNAPPKTEGFAHPVRNVAALGLQGGMRVADFGAGSGAYVLAIADRLGGTGRVYAIDVQRDLLQRIAREAARRGHRNVDIIAADLEMPGASKLADASIDLVLISNLLFQVADRLTVVREARRIVKPAGSVAVIDWSESFRGLGPHPDHVVTRDDALQLLERAGFELVRQFSAGAHHYGLIARPV